MSFLSDLFEGNFGNLGHDLSAHWQQDLPLEIGAVGALATGGLGLAGIGPLAGVLGGAEAAGAGAGLGAEAGALGAEEAATTAGTSALDTLGVSGAGSDALGAFASAPGELSGGTATSADLFGTGATQGTAGSFGPAGAPGGMSISETLADVPEQPSFLEKLGTGAVKSLTNNPLGIAAAGGGLAMNMLRKPSLSPAQQAAQTQAEQLARQGQQLQSYLAGGTLPPNLQAQLDQATAAAKARIIANHAKNGMSTDPAMNSALGQELSQVEINAKAAMADAEIKMMQTGLNATGLSTQLYEMLAKMDRQDNTDLMSAIANFAAALGGGRYAMNKSGGVGAG